MPETNNKEVGTNIAFDAIRIGLASPEKYWNGPGAK